MIIPHDPDEYVTVPIEGRTCPFHQKHPGESYAGCTCSGGWSQRKATPEEYRAARRKRLAQERARLNERLDAINREMDRLDDDRRTP